MASLSAHAGPASEAKRLASLRALEILDTPPEQALDDLVSIATQLCDAPIALISLVDEQRQWFKARVGLSVEETPRQISFCTHAIEQAHDNLFIVDNAARDERFRDNPLVTGEPHVRFYAGAPLQLADGSTVGTLCVLDRVPRALSEGQKEALRALRRQVETHLDLRKTALELRRAQANEHRLVQFIVHDLNSPVQVVAANAKFLEDGLRAAESAGSDRAQDLDVVKDIREGAESLTRMIRNILDVGRAQDGVSLRVTRSVVPLRAVGGRLQKLFERNAEERSVQLAIAPSFDERTVNIDAELLHRLLSNLLDNALRHSPRGTRVEVSVRLDEAVAVFAVDDEGAGIPAAQVESLFDVYGQGKGSTGSQGLGLAFCRAAAQALSGSIRVEPFAPGAHFRVEIPVV